MSEKNVITYVFKPLVENLGREAFSCGHPDIDKWFRKKAWDHHKAFRCRVFTVHSSENDGVVGFYAFCITLDDERLLDRSSHLRRHSVRGYFPTLSIHWVAVQMDFQGHGIGTIIMGRIIGAFKDAADVLGIPVMTLVAANARVAKLYSKMGFVPYGGPGSSRMLLPARTVLDLSDETPSDHGAP